MGADVMIPTPMGSLGELPPPRAEGDDASISPRPRGLVSRIVAAIGGLIRR